MLREALFFSFVFYNMTISDCKQKEIRRFPKEFMFGAATASYQIEGGWNADGKAENIWDHMTHEHACSVVDCLNADTASDSYTRYRRDVEMMRELGLDFYKFSLSWSRILPTSFADSINQDGVRYYNELIDEMLQYNIQPMLTIYHWDLPQKLQDMGGWTNPYIVDWYADYARVAFELYGDRVKYWITINDPGEICYQGYGDSTRAPGLNIKGIAEYLCAKNVLLAHAKAYHIFDQEFRSKNCGNIFITFGAQFFEPNSENDVNSAKEANQFEWGLYSHPIFSTNGDFPEKIKVKLFAKSIDQGFPRSRLPEFTPEEVELVRGTSDFFGLSHYTTQLVYRNNSAKTEYEVPSLMDDLEVITYQPFEWDHGAIENIKVVPTGFYKLLTKIRKYYDNPPVYITENGFPTHTGLDDHRRIEYFLLYMSAMLDAIEAGSDIRGYAYKSLMDCFEWTRGYSVRFGLYEVDFESPHRTRTPRKSAYVYKKLLRTGLLDFYYEPVLKSMSIDAGH